MSGCCSAVIKMFSHSSCHAVAKQPLPFAELARQPSGLQCQALDGSSDEGGRTPGAKIVRT
eukprot:14185055-Alexandrium_andersonii.AAC.1